MFIFMMIGRRVVSIYVGGILIVVSGRIFSQFGVEGHIVIVGVIRRSLQMWWIRKLVEDSILKDCTDV